MTTLAHVLHIVVPTVVVPTLVFGFNWVWRAHENYAQTAPSDFLLAVMIFDLAAISTAHDLQPFIKNHDLRDALVSWHLFLFAVVAFIYWLVVKLSEPLVAAYYRGDVTRGRFGVALVASWSTVVGLVSTHIGYFVWG